MNFLSVSLLILLVLALVLFQLRRARLAGGIMLSLQPVAFLAICLTIVPFSRGDDAHRSNELEFRRLGGIVFNLHGAVFEQLPWKHITVGEGQSDQVHIDNSAESLFRLDKPPAGALRRNPKTQALVAMFVDSWDAKALPGTTAATDGFEVCVSNGSGACTIGAPHWRVRGQSLQVSLDGTAAFEAACNFPFEYLSSRVQARWGGHDPKSVRVYPLAIYGRPGCRGPAIRTNAQAEVDFSAFFHYGKDDQLQFTVAQSEVDDSETDTALGRNRLMVLSATQLQKDIGQAHAAAGPDAGNGYRVRIYRSAFAVPREEPISRITTFGAPSVEIGISQFKLVSEIHVDPISSDNKETPSRWRVDFTPTPWTFIPATVTCASKQVLHAAGVTDGVGETNVRVPFLRRVADVSPLGIDFEISRSTKGGSECSGLSTASISATGSSGIVESVNANELVALGVSDGPALLVSVAELTLPIKGIVALLVSMALLRVLIRNGADKPWPCSMVLALGAVDFLLVMRIAAAMQEYAVSPSIRGSIASALAAALLVPLIAEYLAASDATRQSTLRLFLVGALFIVGILFAMCWRNALDIGSLDFKVVSFMTAALIVVMLAAGAKHKIPMPIRWSMSLENTFFATPMFLKMLTFLIPFAHLILVTLGIRERIGSIGVTTFMVPAYILCFAYFTHAFLQHPKFRRLLVLIVFGFLMPTVAFKIANDSGSIIYLAGLMVLFAFLKPEQNSGNLDRKSTLIIWYALSGFGAAMYSMLYAYLNINIWEQPPFGPTGFGLLLIVIVAALMAFNASAYGNRRSGTQGTANGGNGWSDTLLRFFSILPGYLVRVIIVLSLHGAITASPQPCFNVKVDDLAACLTRNDLQTNQLRLSRIFLPAVSEAEFSREAHGMNSVFDEMRWLVSNAWGGLQGRGFLNVPTRQGLDAFDGAPAIHIIGPFGRGTAAMLVLWLVCAVAAAFAEVKSSCTFSQLRRCAALTVFAFVSGYMILANLELLPFTGRNVYLLAARSQADLIEGFFVIVLIFSRIKAGLHFKEKTVV